MPILRNLCESSKRYTTLDSDEFAAYKKEIGSIELHNLEDYVLYLYNNNIHVDNTCNSLVAYLINIADKRPTINIAYKGGTLPDVDTDIADNKRQEVIKYIFNKYGMDKVAGIGAYGIMWAKGAVRNAGRALGYDVAFVDQVAKLIPELEQGRNWHVDEALERSAELRKLCETDPNAKDIIDWASRLDGTINNKTQHAAGFVITEHPIWTLGSTWINNEGLPVLEFTDKEAESLSMVKSDFLGLRTLTIIADTFELIRQRHGKVYQMKDVPLDDASTYKLFATGNLLGIFQLEGKSISGYTQKFKPVNLMDVTLISAGYRPRIWDTIQ